MTTIAQAMNKQHGSILVVALIIVFLISLLSLTVLRTAGMQQKLSTNNLEITRSFEAAEAGLITGENWLLAQSTEPTTYDTCPSYPCVVNYNPAFYFQDQTNSWWAANSAQVGGGTMNGVSTNPYYVVQFLQFVADSDVQIGAGQPVGTSYYRVISYGVGMTNTSSTILFSTVAERY